MCAMQLFWFCRLQMFCVLTWTLPELYHRPLRLPISTRGLSIHDVASFAGNELFVVMVAVAAAAVVVVVGCDFWWLRSVIASNIFLRAPNVEMPNIRKSLSFIVIKVGRSISCCWKTSVYLPRPSLLNNSARSVSDDQTSVLVGRVPLSAWLLLLKPNSNLLRELGYSHIGEGDGTVELTGLESFQRSRLMSGKSDTGCSYGIIRLYSL